MTPQDIGDIFLRDYLVAMYLATLGVVQIGASHGGISGMLFLRSERASRVLGSLLMVGALVFFFTVPLWDDGPWGAESPNGVTGREGRTVVWETSSWDDLTSARNINDIDGGFSGGSQGIWFPLAAGLALISTYVISSIIHRSGPRPPSDITSNSGVEHLKSSTWLKVVRPSLGYWRHRWRSEVADEFALGRPWGGVRWLVWKLRSK
ncbi:MAG: hypothetical protein HQ478_15835 [Chloroflexi bacterium]|nr:hypothetical protein [Chloroflexota bacterium]